jgi:hypothetical protein
VVREITKLFTMRERSVVKSSVIASTKYSCSGSLDILAKGSTTIDRRGVEAPRRRIGRDWSGSGGACTGTSGIDAAIAALMAYAGTGRAMFLTLCSPMSSKA